MFSRMKRPRNLYDRNNAAACFDGGTSVTNRQRSWLVVATMTLCVAIIVPPAAVINGVFLPPLLKSFGRSHAVMGLVLAIGALGASIFGPAAGFLLDRIEARLVAAGGALVAGCGLLLASQAHTFLTLISGFGLFGVGAAGVGVVPAAAVVSNWFEHRRGLALAITMSGIPAGAALLAPAASYLIVYASWRWAYVMLSALTFLLIPIILTTVKSRPDSLTRADHRDAPVELPGLELGEALRRREFWLLCYISFVHLLTGSALNTHAITYFVGLGMAPTKAALLMSMAFAVAAVTKPLLGAAADRFGVQPVLAVVMAMLGIGALALLKTTMPLFTPLFTINYGVGVGAPAALIPMLAAEAFGLKRFGSLWGGVTWFNMLAFFGGSFGTGYIFDLTGSYTAVFIILGVVAAFATPAPLACRAFSQGRMPETAVRAASPVAGTR
jgi:MFS family permease